MERFCDMLITERKFSIFKIVNVYFSDELGTVNIPDCDVVTYHTFKNWGNIRGFDRKHCFTTTIDLNQSIDEIWNKIMRQHKRHIHRAEKNGTIVTVSDKYKEFHQIYKRFLKQKKYTDLTGLKILPLKLMQKYGMLFIAENQGEILGGNLYFHDGHDALLICHTYQLNGNTIDRKKQIADANCYLHWEAIRYFKNLNITNYDLGGLGSNEIYINHHLHGLDYFKRCYGGNVTSQYEYRKFKSQFNKFLFSSLEFFSQM
jgi:hypothetical protein